MTAYFVLEGPDGGGKTTQARRMCAWLGERGHRVRHLREPGSTGLGEGLRRVLLAPETGELTAAAEALLFSAARAEMIEREVRPALCAGEVVVCERCYLSTWVYQGSAHEHPVELEHLRRMTDAAVGETRPARVFVLDVPWTVRRARRGGGGEDRIEARGEAYHERVRAGYAALAASEAEVELLDASGDADGVHAMLRERLTAWAGGAA